MSRLLASLRSAITQTQLFIYKQNVGDARYHVDGARQSEPNCPTQLSTVKEG